MKNTQCDRPEFQRSRISRFESLSLPSRTKMYLCMTPVDMRKSFDGLFGIVQQEFQLDPLTRHLFLFVNRRRDRMKAIFWDGDGCVIWYKRLEVGSNGLIIEVGSCTTGRR